MKYQNYDIENQSIIALSFWIIVLVGIVVYLVLRKSKKKDAQSNQSKPQNARNAPTNKNDSINDTEISDDSILPLSQYQYRAKKHIMTNYEEKSYRKLISVFNKKFYVIPQISLATLLDHKVRGQNWYGAFQHINRKTVDYILLNKITLELICAVELDDYTHEWEKRRERDLEVERIFREAGIPLVRLNNITNLSNTEIIACFAKVINADEDAC